MINLGIQILSYNQKKNVIEPSTTTIKTTKHLGIFRMSYVRQKINYKILYSLRI